MTQAKASYAFTKTLRTCTVWTSFIWNTNTSIDGQLLKIKLQFTDLSVMVKH